MTDYRQRLWQFPVLAIVANVVLLLWLVPFRKIAVEVTMHL